MVEVAHHARIREACSCRSAECSIPEEVAADKTLALFDRPAARDLVDVAALSQRYILEQLCELAAEKDPGFDRGRCVGRDRSSLRQSFAELGLEPKAVAAPRAGAARCRAQLLGARGHVHPRRRAVLPRPPLPGPEAPGSPSPPKPSKRHRPPPFNAGRNGQSASLERLAELNLARRPVIGTATLSALMSCQHQPPTVGRRSSYGDAFSH